MAQKWEYPGVLDPGYDFAYIDLNEIHALKIPKDRIELGKIQRLLDLLNDMQAEKY